MGLFNCGMLIPNAAQFPSRGLDISEKLIGLMGGVALDYSFDSAFRIDHFIVESLNVGRSKLQDYMLPLFFEPIVAYIGECIIRKTGARWMTVPSGEDGSFEPILRIDGSDEYYSIAFDIFVQLDEGESGFCLGMIPRFAVKFPQKLEWLDHQ